MIGETELKLELTPECADILEASPLFVGRPSSVTQHSTYFDTPDSLLSKAGLSLRIRLSNGKRIQTVKGGSGCAGLFLRSEWETLVDGNEPIIDDATPMLSLLGERVSDIGPIFEVRISRQTWLVEHGATLIEVALDRGEVVAGDRRAPICEIELELKAGKVSELFALARKIDAIAPATLGVLSKSERGYRLRAAVATCFKAEPIILEQGVTVENAFRQVAIASIRQFRLNEVLIGSQNPDSLHQARVALRRLRSAIKIFKPILADDDFPLIRDSVRWLAGELGSARNLDVLVARATTQPLHDELEAARVEAYSRVSETLSSARVRALMINLVEWISDGRWLSRPYAQSEGKKETRVMARGVFRRLRKRVKNAGDISALNDEQRHLVRRNAKTLRYASEFFASLFDDKDSRRRRKRFIDALERLQGELGVLNDLATVRAVLQGLGLAESPSARLLLSMSRKPEMLAAASEARDDLIDAKRFWS
jgi:triphosphatase